MAQDTNLGTVARQAKPMCRASSEARHTEHDRISQAMCRASDGERQTAERTSAGPKWDEHSLVFPSQLGTRWSPDNLGRSWGRISKAAGISGVPFYDIRAILRVAPARPQGTAAHRPRDRRPLRHRNHDDDLRSRVARRETGRAADAGGKPSAEDVAVKRPVRRNPAGCFGWSNGIRSAYCPMSPVSHPFWHMTGTTA
jgi:hypothetical protein